jgi:alkanesulfonate monooxygenase SsuD/methylene tetrahydromethanopterin reductase-like flavin-dependent oxidoreductase (luciferase family)
MMKYSAVGTPENVREYLDSFAKHADADELIVAHLASSVEARLRSVDLLADVNRAVAA